MIILSKDRAEVKRFKIKFFCHLSVKEYADTPENNELVIKLKHTYGADNVERVEVIE